MNIEITDIETYNEAFIICTLDRDTLKKLQFEISFRKNNTHKLLSHLKQVKGQIGYNNLNFDYPILHWFINNYHKYDQHTLPKAICEKAQEIIQQEFSSISPKNVKIPQLDLFRIWHYSNKARMTSLKYLEFNMRRRNIGDLPYGVYDHLTSEMIDKIIEYCHDDVDATHDFYLKSKGRIDLRNKLQKTYGLPLINRPDVGIAEDLVLDSYCKQTGRKKYEVKKLKTEHNFIQAKDVILPQIKFKTPQMQDWLDKLKLTYLKRMGGFWKGDIVKLFGEEYQVKLGGLHIIQKAGIYKKAKDEQITERDCAGMYGTFIALHGMYPKHLGKEFLTLYRKIRDDRMTAKFIGDKVMDAAGKLMSNGIFGKFGSDTSYLFDLKMLYTTTLNNQLFLLMLIERCGINNIKIISANTDSITTHTKYKQIPLLNTLIKEWEQISLHTLESTEYKFIAYRDVNSYIYQKDNDKIGYIGAFDTHDDKDNDKYDGWHKNHSMMIVPIALKEYYVNNIRPEDTIKNHTDLFDFCKVAKAIGKAKYIDRIWSKDQNKFVFNKLQKVNRYIVTNDGTKLIKLLPQLEHEDGTLKKDKIANYRKGNPLQIDMFHVVNDPIIIKDRESEVEAGYQTKILNRINSIDIKDYNINFEYYIKEVYKIINQINK